MKTRLAIVAIALALLVAPGVASADRGAHAPMLTPADGWDVSVSFTVGDYVGNYLPVGILDGIGAYQRGRNGIVRAFVNHELVSEAGASYELANGTELTGARISWFDLNPRNRRVIRAGLAYDTAYDIYGDEVVDAAQLGGGFNRFCSGRGVLAGELGFVDNIHLAGEETFDGQLYALDIKNGEIWGVAAAGAMAWENVTPVDYTAGGPDSVALLIGDDRVAAPLWLYVGQKDAVGDGSFLDRNGLAVGTLHYWVSDAGYVDPSDWSGTGTSASGYWKAVDASVDVNDAEALLEHAYAGGAFQFSRPEDVHDNPYDSSQVVLASTGRDSEFDGADSWGTTYIVDVDDASLDIVYDGDDMGGGQFAAPQFGLRSPDNLTWAHDGLVYIQEDRAVSSDLRPTWAEGGEAKIWALDPASGEVKLIAEVDRSAVPDGQVDGDPDDVGDWETSGIIDVTDMFRTRPGETLLLADVQAHSLAGGIIDDAGLVQGGQLVFLSNASSGTGR